MAERQLPKLHTGVRFPSPAYLKAKPLGNYVWVIAYQSLHVPAKSSRFLCSCEHSLAQGPYGFKGHGGYSGKMATIPAKPCSHAAAATTR